MSLPANTVRKLMREHLPEGPGLEVGADGAEAMSATLKQRLGALAGVVDITGQRSWSGWAEPLVAFALQEPGREDYYDWRRLEVMFHLDDGGRLVLKTFRDAKPVTDLDALMGFVRACQAAQQRRRAQEVKREKLRNLKAQAIIARIKRIAKEDGFDFATRADSVKLTLYIRLSGHAVIEIRIPFKKFEEILPSLRAAIADIRQLHGSGIHFNLKQSSPRLDWVDHKTL